MLLLLFHLLDAAGKTELFYSSFLQDILNYCSKMLLYIRCKKLIRTVKLQAFFCLNAINRPDP